MVSRGCFILSVLLLLSPACGDAGTGTGGESATAGSTSTAGTSTGTAPTSSTGTPTTGTPGTTGTGTDSATSAPTTSTTEATTETGTTAVVTATGEPGTTTGTTTSTTSTTEPDTTTEAGSTSGSSSTTTTTGGMSEPPPAPDMLAGCQTCDCCDPWWISWGEVPGATHYVVRWKCSINPEQVHDVGPVTTIADVCNDIDMCNGMCAFTVGYVRVEACNEDGCSAPVDIPAPQIPLTCGGGCCC